MADRYFYDFKIGERFESASLEVSEEDIIAFASSYDPQPWHLDHAAAAASPFKGLVASGWHTAAITMRLVVESDILKATGVLGTGIDELRWVRPVRPGDIVRVTGEIVALEPPKSGRNAGTMRVRLQTVDRTGEIVMSAIAILRVPSGRGMHIAEATRPHRSLWLESSLRDELDAPALTERLSVDVAIIGGGYVGLWTALHIKELEPHCRVAVLERDICGGGASGRNGGFVLSWWPKFPSLVKAFGGDEALRLVRASEDAIDNVGSFCREHCVDAHFTQAGWLWTATSAAQENSWDTVVARAEALSPGTFARIDPREVATRSGSSKHRAGVLERRAATVQPAALVRGMRRVAISKGVQIFEHTAVRRFSRAHPLIAETPAGSVAANAIVLATNAWAIGIPELSRSIAVISSDIVATEPVLDRLAEIGWTGGECIADSQMMVCYYRTTRDGRIAFGKGGWGLVYGDRIGPDLDRDPKRAALVTRDFRRYYPMLADVPVTHDWCGPIDRSADGLPVIGTLGSSGAVHFGIGWSGNGVGPSVVGGKILASLALARKDEWSSSGLVNRRTAAFPPEPIRYLGAHIVRKAVLAKEEAEMAGRSPSSIAVRLARLAPAGLEDKA